MNNIEPEKGGVYEMQEIGKFTQKINVNEVCYIRHWFRTVPGIIWANVEVDDFYGKDAHSFSHIMTVKEFKKKALRRI